MNTKRTLLFTSSSALAAGMAQAAVHYTPDVNTVIPLPATPTTGAYFDLNNDGIPDFGLGFSGYTQANHQKPYIFGYPSYNQGSAVLARTNVVAKAYGLPVAHFGDTIDQNYLEPNLSTADANHSYFDQEPNGNYVGDWISGARTEGYIGLELFDLTGGTTNYGWAHIIFDDTANPPSLTLVDYAYEDSNMVGIVAGATNTLGVPTIYGQPLSQSVGFGSTAQFNVTVLAKPAPAYQWRAGAVGSGNYTNLTDSASVSGSTTDTLTLNGVLTNNILDYVVVITNTLGSVTSTPATLTVIPPVSAPASQILYGGLTGRFHIDVAPGLSATYRWRHSGVNLSDDGRVAGSATPNLAIGNLQPTDAGNYDVVMSASSQTFTSSVASVSIIPVESQGIYEAAVAAARPAAYYRLNETGNPANTNLVAYDNAGGFNGIYGIDVTNGFAGIAGPRPSDGFLGFAANNLATRYATNDAVSSIALPPWHLNTDTVTFTAWINPANAIQDQINGIVMSGTTNGSFAGIRYCAFTNDLTGWDLGYGWNDITGASQFWGSGIAAPAGQWSFVALTITPSNATLYVFNATGVSTAVDDGTATGPFSPFTNQVMTFDLPAYIGTNPDGVKGNRNFEGAIDEVAVFNRALGSNDLQVLYNAALGTLPPVELQITGSGSNTQLSWGTLGRLLEATNVNGPWVTNSLASSPYTIPLTGTQKFYRVLVH